MELCRRLQGLFWKPVLPLVVALQLILVQAAPVRGASLADTPDFAARPSAAPGQPGTQGMTDPIVGSIEGHPIYLSELGQASETLPDNLRGLPFDTLYPALLDRMIDHEALVIIANRDGVESQPQVQRQIQAATEKILVADYLGKEVAQQVTEAAILARYNRLYANQPGTEEVHARHILLPTEAEARKVLAQLKQGADFASVASAVSKDPDATKGGDLGFFRRDQVWPGFADLAFSLSPGQVAPDPVKNEFGWHVVKVEERRQVAPPTLADVHDRLRRDLLTAGVQQAIQQARAQLLIHRFNMDGTDMDAAQSPDADAAGPALPINDPDGGAAPRP